MTKPSIKDMLAAGAHFGHVASHWHPKMAPYLHGVRNDIHVIDLEKTLQTLPAALEYMKGIAARGGKVLFVGTKAQAQDPVKLAAESCNMPYVTGRWLGGTLTNYPQIRRSIKELQSLKDQQAKGELRKYTKKEQVVIGRKIVEMTEKLGGIANLEAVPEAILAFDVRHEKTAIEEAKSVGVKVVALCDSNVNPAPVDFVVPGNDDSVKSISLFANLAAEAIKEGNVLAAAAALERKAAMAKPVSAPAPVAAAKA